MTALDLAQLGWRPFFQQKVDLELREHPVGRVVTQHRNRLGLRSAAGTLELAIGPAVPAITVGDWLLLTPEGRFLRLLERQSLFRRKAPGSKVEEQLMRVALRGSGRLRPAGSTARAGGPAWPHSTWRCALPKAWTGSLASA